MARMSRKRNRGLPRSIKTKTKPNKESTNQLLFDPLTELTNFPKIPTEVRDMIWDLAISAQVITIKNVGTAKDENWFEAPVPQQGPLKPAAFYKIPALLHVNQEARNRAQKALKPLFGEHLGGNPIYFNPTKDTLNFNSLNAFFAFVAFLLQPSQNHVSVPLSGVGKIWVRRELVETLHHITFEMKFERKHYLMHLLLPILSKLKTVKFLAAFTDEEVQTREVGLQIMATSAETFHGSGYVLPQIGLVTPSQLKRVLAGLPIREKKSRAGLNETPRRSLRLRNGS